MFIDLEFHQSREWFYVLYYLSLMSIPILLLQIKKNRGWAKTSFRIQKNEYFRSWSYSFSYVMVYNNKKTTRKP